MTPADFRKITDAANAAFDETYAENLKLLGDNIAKGERIESLEAELAECIANCDQPPPTNRTTYGACPRTGRNNTSDPGKYFGTPADVRWFGVAVQTVPPRPSKALCGTFFASWKPFTAGGTPTKQQFLMACDPLEPGDFITWEHEYDVKYLNDMTAANKITNPTERAAAVAKAEADLKRRLELIALCHAYKEELRPDLFTYPTVAGWRFTTNGGMDKFNAVGDYVGIDFDGVNTSYYDFAQPAIMARAKTYADTHHDGNIVIPEWGWPRQANDPNGTGRVTAINKQTPLIVAALKPKAQIWFDSDSFPGYPLTLANEIAAWSAFVDTNPS
jgi:hypothetical protein